MQQSISEQRWGGVAGRHFTAAALQSSLEGRRVALRTNLAILHMNTGSAALSNVEGSVVEGATQTGMPPLRNPLSALPPLHSRSEQRVEQVCRCASLL